ncbi:MAG: dephospho-CoA kinase [Candidatus Omnitrophica bacterium]|nr:dephospho-CoA kinase [Candidatus Omnitrophota bacterium]MDD5652756.1 dephospho-CoA kinase [Candidatus Omnitrophota bacterium]
MLRKKRMLQKKIAKKTIVGLTGSFGSGKSTAARYFKAHGCTVIDADKIAHSLLKPGTSTCRKVKKLFSGSLSRKNIGALVFKNRKLLTELNRIIHPRVIRMIKDKIRTARPGLVILDVPLLIESGMYKNVDKVIVVKINRKEQIKRMKKKFSFSEAEVLNRIKAQLPLSDKVRIADFVIDNSGSLQETKKQVEKIRRQLWKN